MSFPWIIARIFGNNGAGPYLAWAACPFRLMTTSDYDEIVAEEEED